MRIAAFGATLLLFLQACSTTPPASDSTYQNPNSLMAGEISRRVEQIPYQHRDELLQNLMWLAQTGEQTIPSVLEGLRHENAKVRSSCAWVLGRIRDRRTIPALQQAMRDGEASVRMEVARSLVTMGDMAWSPALIEGLDSEKKEVRYMCHETLKTATGHDFGYDHLNQNDGELKLSVLRWRQWWSEYSGDGMFASSYQQKHGLQPQLAAPAGETKPNGDAAPMPAPQPMPQPMPQPDGSQSNGTQSGASMPNATMPNATLPNATMPNGSSSTGTAPNGTATPSSSPMPAPGASSPNGSSGGTTGSSLPSVRPNGG